MPWVKFEDLQIEKEVGRGAFGRVYSAWWRGSAVAVKRMSEGLGERLEHVRMMDELRIMVLCTANTCGPLMKDSS